MHLGGESREERMMEGRLFNCTRTFYTQAFLFGLVFPINHLHHWEFKSVLSGPVCWAGSDINGQRSGWWCSNQSQWSRLARNTVSRPEIQNYSDWIREGSAAAPAVRRGSLEPVHWAMPPSSVRPRDRGWAVPSLSAQAKEPQNCSPFFRNCGWDSEWGANKGQTRHREVGRHLIPAWGRKGYKGACVHLGQGCGYQRSAPSPTSSPTKLWFVLFSLVWVSLSSTLRWPVILNRPCFSFPFFYVRNSGLGKLSRVIPSGGYPGNSSSARWPGLRRTCRIATWPQVRAGCRLGPPGCGWKRPRSTCSPRPFWNVTWVTASESWCSICKTVAGDLMKTFFFSFHKLC